MARYEPETDQRTRARVTYGEAMAHETLTIVGGFDGRVTITDSKSGEQFAMSPEVALELAEDLKRAARDLLHLRKLTSQS